MSGTARQPATEVNLSRMERKAKATDEAFRTIVDSEAALRDKKTERLRTLRLQKEAAERAQKATSSGTKKKK
ncbi:hypothetical protein GCM10011385_03920 [Nitratireductor aestuarii]|uniref:Uncharacterized protein n=2 Tax=Nitratireductor aestuarii TaxID=1735103 RepID=A0A916VZ49_9HYPH|nr:hypothetical protein GCM10011385_03920 [Nitratireductor aestuarii]